MNSRLFGPRHTPDCLWEWLLEVGKNCLFVFNETCSADPVPLTPPVGITSDNLPLSELTFAPSALVQEVKVRPQP
jgi:hypothetical protein